MKTNLYSCWETQTSKYQHGWVNVAINYSKLGLKNCYKQRDNLITTPKAFIVGLFKDIICVAFTHLCIFTSTFLQNLIILDIIKIYFMAYTFIFEWFLWICCAVFYRLTSWGRLGGGFVAAGCTRVHHADSLWWGRQRWGRCHDDNRFSISLNACVIYRCTECIFYHT